jgi:hypothetical protein
MAVGTGAEEEAEDWARAGAMSRPAQRAAADMVSNNRDLDTAVILLIFG